jgi:lipopolysaccharide export system permease protein
VFVSTQENGKLTVTSAQRGHIETQGHERVLVLEKGRNLESWQDPTANDGTALRIADFERYNILVSQIAPVASAPASTPVRARSTLELMQASDRKGHAELSWRLGLAFAGFNFLLIALASTRINPRAGRSLNTIFALLAFVVYYNLITLGQSWIGSGRIGLLPWLIVLHGGMLLLGLFWLLKRDRNCRMKTIRSLIYKEVLQAVLLVAFGFLALFFFFDLVDELQDVGSGVIPYQLSDALLYTTLLLPGHLYELLPIAVLLGTIFVMARFAQSSEFTILRTSGLGPWRALRTLLVMGLGFVVLTFTLGDYVSPFSDRGAQLLKAKHEGDISVGQTGAWLREAQGERRYSVNVGALSADNTMRHIRIYAFDEQGYLASMTEAASARFGPGHWQLQQVERNIFPAPGNNSSQLKREQLARLDWPTEISSPMVSAAVLKPERMSALALFQYIQHLEANEQSSQRYAIEFWKKVFFPLSCLVMVVLALPFAYLHFRSGNMAGYVFVGVLIGISFFMLNNVFGYIGNLRNWSPWIAAAAPGLLYSLLSLGAFGWLVLKR